MGRDAVLDPGSFPWDLLDARLPGVAAHARRWSADSLGAFSRKALSTLLSAFK